jgi:hypothetical protein
MLHNSEVESCRVFLGCCSCLLWIQNSCLLQAVVTALPRTLLSWTGLHSHKRCGLGSAHCVSDSCKRLYCAAPTNMGSCVVSSALPFRTKGLNPTAVNSKNYRIKKYKFREVWKNFFFRLDFARSPNIHLITRKITGFSAIIKFIFICIVKEHHGILPSILPPRYRCAPASAIIRAVIIMSCMVQV